MSEETYRGIVVGCGKIGALLETQEGRIAPRSHAGALAKNPRTSLAALVDTDAHNLDVAGKLFPEAGRYGDPGVCLREVHPDIAIIATPSAYHASAIAACAEAGVSVIIGEKPLAATMSDAVRIRDIVEKNNTTFALNYQRRLFPLFRDARESIASGELGRIQQITCYYGNGTYNNAGHSIDAVMFLLSERVISVLGAVNEKNTTHPVGDPNIDGILMSEHGTSIALQSFDQGQFGIHDINIYGEKSAIMIRNFGYEIERVPVDANAPLAPQLAYDRAEHRRDERSMTADVLAEAIASHEEGRQPATGVENGIETLAVLEALSQSARQGGGAAKVEYTS